MGTRATITVYGEGESYCLYRHNDSSPKKVFAEMREALRFAWPLPRYEANEFAAAIVCASKRPGGGHVRLSNGRDDHLDTDYHYTVLALRSGDDKENHLLLTCFTRSKRAKCGWMKGEQIIFTPADSEAVA